MANNISPVSAVLALVFATTASPAAAAVPYQWLAKQYSEGLGRGPDPGSWSGHVEWFRENGCSRLALKTIGREILTGPEFETRSYGNAERVFVAYRAILSREPDQGGFGGWLACMNFGRCTWPHVIDAFYDSPEFGNLVVRICSGGPYDTNVIGPLFLPRGAPGPAVIFFYGRPIAIGGERSQALLQSQLDAGGTVCLNPQEVVYLTRKLFIPANASLVTCDVGDRFQTAKFARLVRDSAFEDAMIETRGTIDRVWVDGQKWRLGYLTASANVVVKGGAVTNSRIAEPLGWTNVHAFESCDSAPTITNNLVTAYTHFHAFGQFADGLSISCDGTYVADNYIIDATDVGIVLFSRGAGSGQNIIVERNTVLAAGRSAFAAFVVCDAAPGVYDAPCTNSSVRNNSLWTSEFQHFDIGISVGIQPWWDAAARDARVENNTTPTGLSIRANNGLVVDGLLNAVVQGNSFSTIAVSTNTCPTAGGVSAHVSGGHAGGIIQSHTDRAVHACVGANH